jgi:serine phosphatase RsbU (regulator of sigma subunit)
MAARSRPNTPLRHFLRLLWTLPLWALPFGLFFGLLFGARDLGSYALTYLVSLAFTAGVTFSLWAAEHVLVPWLRRRAPAMTARSTVAEGMIYAIVSVLGTYATALVLRATVLPTFLGTGTRAWLIFTAFTLLFTVLFTAVSYAIVFYNSSLDRARSDQELSLARRIQRSFLLSQFPDVPRLEMHAVNVSSKQVSGDFYDVVPAGDDSLLLAVADVSGKGVPAALLTSMLQASLRTQAMSVPSVGRILSNVNQLVYRSTSMNQFATFFLARVHERSLRLEFSNAGHNFPVVYRRGGERVMLERGGTVIGILENAAFEEGGLDLLPGDRVLLYTDGINEAENAAREMFGEDRIHACIESLPAHLSAREVVEALLASVRKFLDGVEPGDDMTVMVLRVRDDVAGPAPARA